MGPRSKSVGENGAKKAAFNENAVKTPHRNKASSKNGQTTQRRRRVLGDISNRKAAPGVGGGKVGVALKQTTSINAAQRFLKPGKALFPSSSAKTCAAQVKFSKTTAAKSVATSKARHGWGSGVKGANSKLKQRTSSAGYDGVFGATTRWSVDDITDENRLPFGIIPKEELNMVSDLQDEMLERRKKKKHENDSLEQERCDKQLLEQICAVHETNDKDTTEMGTMLGSCGISGDDPWDLWDPKLPWEEEDQINQPSEERSLLGTDLYSLWDDI